jgi:hypothetical protein
MCSFLRITPDVHHLTLHEFATNSDNATDISRVIPRQLTTLQLIQCVDMEEEMMMTPLFAHLPATIISLTMKCDGFPEPIDSICYNSAFSKRLQTLSLPSSWMSDGFISDLAASFPAITSLTVDVLGDNDALMSLAPWCKQLRELTIIQAPVPLALFNHHSTIDGTTDMKDLLDDNVMITDVNNKTQKPPYISQLTSLQRLTVAGVVPLPLLVMYISRTIQHINIHHQSKDDDTVMLPLVAATGVTITWL